MKSKKGFRPLRRKIFLRAVTVLAATTIAIYFSYTVLLQGHFANGMIALFQSVLGVDYDVALQFYEHIFRSHKDAIILLSLLLVAVGLFWIFLRWLTKYYADISKGMDTLLQDIPGEISLPPELLPIERKINLAKHTIDRQKSDMLLAEQKKNDLVMYLAHDLKTPLASSISYLNLLRDEKQLSEELREKYLTIALAKSERLEDLINEFLEIARYSLSTIALQYSEINLTRLLEQLVYEFQPVLDQKGLTCRLAAGEDILLNCDADKMQRVFDNLLRNAVNYSYGGTEITIETESGEDCIKLRLSNHGGTIPQEKLERIFEQFYRLDTGRGSSGAGLGLAIARQIVTLHKGTITAESRDGLTVFTVALPAVS
ncbi:HAMP domain-containing sensor histidine kinase [Oscillospiraceae bacterium 21-37]